MHGVEHKHTRVRAKTCTGSCTKKTFMNSSLNKNSIKTCLNSLRSIKPCKLCIFTDDPGSHILMLWSIKAQDFIFSNIICIHKSANSVVKSIFPTYRISLNPGNLIFLTSSDGETICRFKFYVLILTMLGKKGGKLFNGGYPSRKDTN